jgi:hypothetical protein
VSIEIDSIFSTPTEDAVTSLNEKKAEDDVFDGKEYDESNRGDADDDSYEDDNEDNDDNTDDNKDDNNGNNSDDNNNDNNNDNNDNEMQSIVNSSSSTTPNLSTIASSFPFYKHNNNSKRSSEFHYSSLIKESESIPKEREGEKINKIEDDGIKNQKEGKKKRKLGTSCCW